MKVLKKSIELEAIQLTPLNIEEIEAFVGGDFGMTPDGPVVATLEGPLHISMDDWVIKGIKGEFYPCKPDIFDELYLKEGEFVSESECTCSPEEKPTFEQDLVHLLNYHSMEKYSGTPDWILANYLVGVLRQFDCAVQIRANWRGESTELPALQRLFDTNDQAVVGEPRLLVAPGALDGNDGKTVPIVQYVDGRRNEIGEAKIQVTPGEVLFTGTLGGIESVVPIMGHNIGEGQFSIADTDPLRKGDR